MTSVYYKRYTRFFKKESVGFKKVTIAFGCFLLEVLILESEDKCICIQKNTIAG